MFATSDDDEWNGNGGGSSQGQWGWMRNLVIYKRRKEQTANGEGRKKRIGDVISRTRWELRSKEEEEQEEGRCLSNTTAKDVHRLRYAGAPQESSRAKMT